MRRDHRQGRPSHSARGRVRPRVHALVSVRVAVLVATAVALAAAGFAAAAWRGSGAAPTTNVRVTAYDFRFTLSRSSVPVGRVRFTVVNRGVFGFGFVVNRGVFGFGFVFFVFCAFFGFVAFSGLGVLLAAR